MKAAKYSLFIRKRGTRAWINQFPGYGFSKQACVNSFQNALIAYAFNPTHEAQIRKVK